jgi:hypothetical protein
VANHQKCRLAVCSCRTQGGNPYCSDYCTQAASQGLENDFCQCIHADCGKPAHKMKALNVGSLPNSISFVPGWVTIEYSSLEDLQKQLMLLAKAIANKHEAPEIRVEAALRRRPSSAGSPLATNAKSA